MDQTAAQTTAGAVRAEMARKRTTGRQLAKDLEWPATSTHRLLTGQRPFRIDQLVAVADYLDVPLSTLLPADRQVAS